MDHEHPETLTPSGADVHVQTLCQTTISFKSPPEKIKMTETKQKEIDDALMQLLVGKVLPISLVDSHYFRDFVHLLNPNMKFLAEKL